MRRRALTRFSVISGCVLVHSLNLGRTRRALRPLAVEKPRLSGHLQAQAQAMASRDEPDGIQAPLLDKATATEALLASDEVATEEQRKKTIRREQNQLDIEGMNAELDVYKTNVKGEDAEDLWKKEFLEFKNGLMLNRALAFVAARTFSLTSSTRRFSSWYSPSSSLAPRLTWTRFPLRPACSLPYSGTGNLLT